MRRTLFVMAGVFAIAGYVGLGWFKKAVAEAVLKGDGSRGRVLVALSDSPAVKEALLYNCRALPGFGNVELVKSMLASGLLAEVLPGTKVRMSEWGADPFTGTMVPAEGPLKGRRIWACRGQFQWAHVWP